MSPGHVGGTEPIEPPLEPPIDSAEFAPTLRLIPRPRVLGLLDALGNHRFVLIRAPAGAGKTTALSQWAELLDGRRHSAIVVPVYRDEAPSALWWRLIRAATAITAPWATPMAGLQPPPAGAGALTGFVRRLIEVLESGGQPLTLAIDDLHHLRDERALASLRLLVESAPRGLRVIATSREAPGLPMGRWRMSGVAAEFRPMDINLTSEELDELAWSYQVRLSREVREQIYARTEGWVGGARVLIAALSERGRAFAPADTAFLDDHDVADYLLEQVVDELDAADQELLVRTSVVDELPIPLAELLAGREDSAQRLRQLANRIGFIALIRGTDERYRYHAMLLRALRRQLDSRPLATRRALHLQAAEWYLARGDIVLAGRQFLHAPDYERVCTLLREHYLARWVHGRADGLRRLLDRVPTEVVQADPELAAIAAFAQAAGERDHRLDLYLAAAQHGVETVSDPIRRRGAALGIAATRITLARRMGDTRMILSIAGDVPAVDPTDHNYRTVDGYLRAVIDGSHGTGLCWAGEFAAARTTLRSVDALAERINAPLVGLNARSMLALTDAFGGRVRSAGRSAEALVREANQRGWSTVTQVVGAHLAAALSAQETDRPAPVSAAIEALSSYQSLAPQSSALQLLELVKARQQMRAGRPRETADTLRRFDHDSGEFAQTAGFDHLIRRAQFQLTRPVIRTPLPPADLRRRIDEQANWYRQDPHEGKDNVVRLNLWSAFRAHLDDDVAERGRRLGTALEIAEQEGYRLPFWEMGAGFAPVLRDGLRDSAHADLIRDLLEAYWPDAAEPGIQLSPRQREVLIRLAEPYTLNDIARQLHVSINTVKSHIRGIYTQLGAQSRNEAVRIARENHLLG